MVITEREREAVAELANDIVSVYRALEPVIKSVCDAASGLVKEDKRKTNMDIVQALLGRLQAEESEKAFRERSQM